MIYSERSFGRIRFMRMTADRGEVGNPPAGSTLRQWRQRIQQDLKHRLLLRAGVDKALRYDNSGKPFLSHGPYVSITHFGYTAALVLAPFPVGLDGEIPGERLLRIRHKFLHEAELGPSQVHNPGALALIWTAKEAVYKLLGKPGLSFVRDIRVLDALPSGTGIARVDGVGEIRLQWFGSDAVFCLAHFIDGK